MLRLRSPHTLVSCTIILCSLLSVGMSAQPRFDTQIANANGKVFTNINQNLIDILTSNGALFDRSRRYFDVGLNWDVYSCHAQRGSPVDVDVSALPAGVYNVVVTSGAGERAFTRCVVIR